MQADLWYGNFIKGTDVVCALVATVTFRDGKRLVDRIRMGTMEAHWQLGKSVIFHQQWSYRHYIRLP
jgi:hypothetical protein